MDPETLADLFAVLQTTSINNSQMGKKPKTVSWKKKKKKKNVVSEVEIALSNLTG